MKFDFSSKNLYHIKKFIGNRVNKISPSYFGNLCGTTGLFIFLIKDALEFAGVTNEKKTQSAILYQSLTYLLDLTNGYVEKLKTLKNK